VGSALEIAGMTRMSATGAALPNLEAYRAAFLAAATMKRQSRPAEDHALTKFAYKCNLHIDDFL
jgi:hypothetical protein